MLSYLIMAFSFYDLSDCHTYVPVHHNCCRSNINISFPGFSREQQHNLTLEIIRQLEGLDFIGVTGPVSFKDGNRVQTQPRVLQYRFDFPDANNIQAEIGTIKFPGMLSSSNTSNITAPLFMYRSGENNITTWPLCE